MTRARLLGAVFAALVFASCTPDPEPADPAIWLVEGPGGQKAWLFGTIHALDNPAAWKTPAVGKALSEADTLMVEVAGLEDQAAMTRTFANLSRTPGQPPLGHRIAPKLRGALKQMLERNGLDEGDFAGVETWAAALTLARAESADSKAEYGIDRAVLAEAGSKRLVELEGTAGQLAIFDRLPEREQRDLLAAVVGDAGALDGESANLALAWRKGDMALIERETKRGLLADPELREALFTGRNERWSERVAREMRAGIRPFVAVGAAHMAGTDGLPSMLSEDGYKVTRLR